MWLLFILLILLLLLLSTNVPVIAVENEELTSVHLALINAACAYSHINLSPNSSSRNIKVERHDPSSQIMSSPEEKIFTMPPLCSLAGSALAGDAIINSICSCY